MTRALAPRPARARSRVPRRAAGALAAAVLLVSACGRHAAAPAPAAAADRAAELRAAIAQGDAAWARRADPAALDEALRAYRAAAAAAPADPTAELPLARAEAFRALAAGASPDGKAASEASARAAERALRTLSPAWARAVDAGEGGAAAAARVEAPGAEALYWLALGTMRAAQATGFAAILAVKDDALAAMDRAEALDPAVDAAGPDRALGAWRAALPAAAGGGADRALAHFERARTLAPDDQLRRVAEAETYAVLVQDGALFDRLLAEVLAFEPARWPARAPENAIARRQAQALRARRAALF